MKYLVYGGQYGSEGKGSFTEYLAKVQFVAPNIPFAAVGEAAPNSGHTCSLGKVRNIPACSFWAERILLGPDSVINPNLLISDLITLASVGRRPKVLIHRNAAISKIEDAAAEVSTDIQARISSTCSGSWVPRNRKYIHRLEDAVIGTSCPKSLFATGQVQLLSSAEWLLEVGCLGSVIFECSQGVMLDTNFGIYPYVTSRSTLPLAALTRNGIHPMGWTIAGVYRTYPIRTGGNSGPTGGMELTWELLNLPREIATVTKRVRRVFQFSADDFSQSMILGRPDILAFTHLDYVPEHSLFSWSEQVGISSHLIDRQVFYSSKCGEFSPYASSQL